MDRKKMKRNIDSLNINNLFGRILKIKSSGNCKNEILALYGHHSSLERMYSIADVLSDYGDVIMPDLPGLGGMDSFYKLGLKPNFDSYADYLAAFIKMRYKRKKVILVGFSFSVPIIIKTLQKYPELINRVEYVVSFVGFSHKDDFIFSKRFTKTATMLSSLGSLKLAACFLKNVVYRPFLIKTVYRLASSKHPKFRSLSNEDKNKSTNFEVELWQKNDLRTWFYTTKQMLQVDLCGEKVRNLEIYHVNTSDDAYLNPHNVTQHLNVIFDKVINFESDMINHMPTIVSSKNEASRFLPDDIKAVLQKNLINKKNKGAKIKK